jgi:hypothetical protein
VSNAAHFKMGGPHHFISHALKGDCLGLKAVDDGLSSVDSSNPASCGRVKSGQLGADGLS